MTDKQKAAFLRSEGWKKRHLWFGYWLDPRPYPDAVTGIKAPRRLSPLELAFRIASRRKASRERASLKRAGMEWDEIYGWTWPVGDAQVWGGRNRSKAFATLKTPRKT